MSSNRPRRNIQRFAYDTFGSSGEKVSKPCDGMSQSNDLQPEEISQSMDTSQPSRISMSIDDAELDASVIMHEALDLIDENPITSNDPEGVASTTTSTSTSANSKLALSI